MFMIGKTTPITLLDAASEWRVVSVVPIMLISCCLASTLVLVILFVRK